MEMMGQSGTEWDGAGDGGTGSLSQLILYWSILEGILD